MQHPAWKAIDEDLEYSSVLASPETTVSPTLERPREASGPRRSSVHGRIVHALGASGDGTLRRRAGRIDGCCKTPAIFVTDEGLPKLVMGCCRDRMCPRCQRLRGRECTRKTMALVQGMNSARFITMGLKDDGRSLKHRMDRLAKGFRKLRANPWFKSNVTGGVYGIEVTRGKHGKHWHVHLHIIAEGSYLDQKTLSEAWLKATGDSPVVHIKAVHDRGAQARYISEYVSKPQDIHGWTDRDLAEYAIALHGRRLLHTFGTLHGKKVEPAEPREPAARGKFLVHTETLREHAAAGDEECQHAASICARISPLWAGTLGLKHHAEAEGLAPVERWELEIVVAVCARLNASMYDAPPPEGTAPDGGTPPARSSVNREQLALLPV
jgi:hypothetical protein